MLDRIHKIFPIGAAWRWLRAPFAVLVAAGALGGLAWWLFIHIPIPPPASPDQFLMKDRLDIMIKVTAGVAAAFGLFVAWRRSEAALTQAETALKQAETADQGQITERFTKAIEQIGSNEIAIRLGGIYALERIALDSERDHWTVMEVLCAYVRQNRPREPVEPAAEVETDAKKPIQTEPVPVDVQAILTVLGRADLIRADLIRADLIRADLRGSNLRDAYLSLANLTSANLSGANLSGAYPITANLTDANLIGADLCGTNLFAADLCGANLSAANLRAASLTNANLHGANLSAAILEGANLTRATLSDANLSDANLSRANLTGTYNLTQEQVNSARGNESTKLPDHLTMPDHWKSDKP